MQETIEEIALADVFLDRETQIRAAASEETIQRYFDAMIDIAARDRFPPIILYRDKNGRLWLADGHHRVMAAIRRKFTTILAIIRPGSKADAIWEAARANGKNGLQLGRADVRRAVEMILESCKDQSLRAIAETVGCSLGYVHKIKNEVFTSEHLNDPGTEQVTKVKGKDGKSYAAKVKTKRNSASSNDDPVSITPTQSNRTNSDCVGTVPASEPVHVEPTTPPEESAEIKRRRDEAHKRELEVVAATDLLKRRIDDWFEVAPDDMHEGFAERNRKRIGALID